MKTEYVKNIFTVEETAKQLHISVDDLRPIVKHILKPQKLGLNYIITKQDIQKLKELIASSPQETQTE